MASNPTKTPAKQGSPGIVTRSEADAIRRKAWPDFWARSFKLAVDSHPFDLRGREFELGILRDESKAIDVPKGAQLGLTTTFIVKCAHYAIERYWHILYLLPLKAGSVQFVQGRIDPIIDSSPILKDEFTRTDNRVQKQTRRGVNWYIRGTNIETELREVPADILVLDERDKANEDNMDDAYARLNGSKVQRLYQISTPTVDGHGVYGESAFPASDQMRWWVACPGCNAKQVIRWEENVMPFIGDKVEDCVGACRCIHCGRSWSDVDRANMNATGTWVPDNPSSPTRGYHLNQFNSPTMALADPRLGILVNWYKGQFDAKKLKAFYNLALGLPYAAPGDKFTPELLDKCRKDYMMGGIPDGPLFIGIDVGHDVLYVSVYTRVRTSKSLRLWMTRVVKGKPGMTKWQVLDAEILTQLANWVAVVDAHPDKEQVETLSRKYAGRLWMGFEKDRPDQHETANFIPHKWNEPAKVNIDRTMAFDSYIKQFMDGNMWLPADARELGEFMPKLAYNGFYAQHLAMVRVEQAVRSKVTSEQQAVEQEQARWVNTRGSMGKKPDHWHHSGMFALMASMRDVPLVVDTEVGGMFVAAGGLIAGGRSHGVEDW